MGARTINYTLPEFAFLDAHTHLGNHFEDRTVILHVCTSTIIEVVNLEGVVAFDFDKCLFKKSYKHTNIYGEEEEFLLLVHYSNRYDESETEVIFEILDQCFEFFGKYLDWEDQNIENENRSLLN